MHIVRRAIFIGCVIFAGALIGDGLQWLVPQAYLSDAKGAVGMVQGLVTLLLALVLGLLVWTSYGVYAQQHSEAQTLGSQILQLSRSTDSDRPPQRGANSCAGNSPRRASASGTLPAGRERRCPTPSRAPN